MSNEIDYNELYDVPATQLKDVAPQKMVKVYPYLLPNTLKGKAFIQGRTTSLIYASQDGLDDSLEVDSNGDRFMEILITATNETQLDITSSTSVFGQEMLDEPSFQAMSNSWVRPVSDNIVLGQTVFAPIIFTIGKPFDKNEYEEGKQAVFIPSSYSEAKGYDYDNNIIDDEGMYTLNLINMKTIEAAFDNARVLFTTTFDTLSDQILTFDGNKTGVTIGFENQTLINFVKGKGKTEEFSSLGTSLGVEFGDIDFISKQPLAPFKMTPVSLQDKLTMYADWFDYDVAMPYVFIEAFRNSGKLSDVIKNEEDRRMVEDMLVVSAGFANSWTDAPVLTSGGDAGKIDPNFRIGWSGIKATSLSGKDPIKVIDGIYETHIREFPVFLTDIGRRQVVREVLSALSRYLYTSYSIGKGQNSFNEAYLPWYLEPSINTPIVSKKEIEINNPDKGGTGKVKTFVIGSVQPGATQANASEDTSFQGLTAYYHSQFTKTTTPEYPIKQELVLPREVDLSNVKILQTDRKISLPELPDTIGVVNKLPLPGDINTNSSNDLQYMWYLPIRDEKVLKDFFVDSLQTTTSIQAGQEITVNVVDGAVGKVFTQQEAQQAAEAQAGLTGSFKVVPNVSNVVALERTNSPSELNYRDGLTTIFEVNETELKRRIASKYGYEDTSSINILTNSIVRKTDKGGFGGAPTYIYTGSIRYEVTKSSFTPAVIIITSGGSVDSFSFKERRVLFDKQQWKRFLTKFNIIPNGVIDYELLEKEGYKIKELNELIIGTAFGNFIELKVSGSLIARIPLFNKDDETIGVQRILFS